MKILNLPITNKKATPWLLLIGQDNLQKALDSPAFNAKPWMYWYWMNGNVSKEGIIADIKGFHEAGISGVNQMDIDFSIRLWRSLTN